MSWEVIVQTIVAMLVITAPFDPVKIVIFNRSIADPPRNRIASAAKVALGVAVILGGAALCGRELLELLGVDLNAFSVVGGLLIVVMGGEMLFGGGASKTQGEEERQSGPGDDDTLLIPLTLPLIAGPGAITTVISHAANSAVPDAVVVTLIAVGAVAVTAFLSYAALGGLIARAKPQAVGIAVRIGGLLLATIGTQMALGGLKRFFA